MVNRTQALVLGFFAMAVGSLLVILVAAPDVYEQALRLPDSSRMAQVGFLAVLHWLHRAAGRGVLWRWRWVFWLILVAFLAACCASRWRSCS